MSLTCLDNFTFSLTGTQQFLIFFVALIGGNIRNKTQR